MTKREIEKYLHSSNINIGFELEVIVPQFEKEHKKAIIDQYHIDDRKWEYDIYTVERNIWLKLGGRAPNLPAWAREMGYRAGDEIPDPLNLVSENRMSMMKTISVYFRADRLPFEWKIRDQYQYTNHKYWIIKPDATLGFSGLELSSPILSMWEFLYIVPKLFKHIDKYDCKTTNQCGFHVGLSFKDKDWSKELDPIKMGLFVDEKFIYKHFPMRKNNEYAESIHTDIKYLMRERYYGQKVIEAVEKKKKRKPKFTENHRMAINIEHLSEKNKYIEFRYTGGKDYHKKWNVIKEIVAMYIRAMHIARTDEKKDEYMAMLKKLGKVK